MKNLIIICLFISIAGCVKNTKPEENLPSVVFETHTEYVIPQVTVDSFYLEPCKKQEVPKLNTFESFLENTVINTAIYSECSKKVQGLQEIINKAFILENK